MDTRVSWVVLEEALVPVVTLSEVIHEVVYTPEMRRIVEDGPGEYHDEWSVDEQALWLLTSTPKLIVEAEKGLTSANGWRLKRYLKPSQDTGYSSQQGDITQQYNHAVEWAKEKASEREIKVLNYLTPWSWDESCEDGEVESVDILRKAMGLDFVGAVATSILRFDRFIDQCEGIDRGRRLEIGAVSEWAEYWDQYFANVEGRKALRKVCNDYHKEVEATVRRA
jgi:hypothetical protein